MAFLHVYGFEDFEYHNTTTCIRTTGDAMTQSIEARTKILGSVGWGRKMAPPCIRAVLWALNISRATLSKKSRVKYPGFLCI